LIFDDDHGQRDVGAITMLDDGGATKRKSAEDAESTLSNYAVVAEQSIISRSAQPSGLLVTAIWVPS
jgi:hypothetical protein